MKGVVIRTTKVLLVIAMIIATHNIIYHATLPNLGDSPEHEFLLWWWAWLVSPPIVALGILVPLVVVRYIMGK